MIRTSNRNSAKAPPTSTSYDPPRIWRAVKPVAPGGDGVQGEGNYEAARVFNAAEQAFVTSGKVGPAARKAAPGTEAERQAMSAAEAAGKRRAKA